MFLKRELVAGQSATQQEPLPGREQEMERNNAGGFAFTVTPWTQLMRFLVLGSESPTYYASQQTLTRDNLQALQTCVAQDGPRAVRLIKEVSLSGRAPKNDYALFALAMCAASTDLQTRRDAFEALPLVARIGTHLFTFCDFVFSMRGSGAGLRRALGRWYNDNSALHVAQQAVKYPSRRLEGGKPWSHADVLRKARPTPIDLDHDIVYNWIVDGGDALQDYESFEEVVASSFRKERTDSPQRVDIVQIEPRDEMVKYIWAAERIKAAKDEAEVCRLIREFGLPREAVPSQHLNSPSVWEELLAHMPMEATVRNLGKMTSVGLIKPFSIAEQTIASRLHDERRIKASRLHPIKLLAAMLTYSSGHGVKGSLTWQPSAAIVRALNDAFYLAFQNAEPSGRRWLIGVDISGSMEGGTIAGVPGLTPMLGAMAMALVTMNVEPQTLVTVFDAKPSSSRYYGSNTSRQSGIREIPTFSPGTMLPDVRKLLGEWSGGGTDCALPMLYAAERKLEIDAFLVITDNETWAGHVHPAQALQQYRQSSGIGSKLVVCAMTSTGFSIADPQDAGMLDCVGFDTAVPQLITDFVR